jgi:hypothetical protein
VIYQKNNICDCVTYVTYLKNNLSVAESQLEQSAPPYGYCPYENAHMYILYIMWLKRVDEIEPQSDTRRLQI